MIDYTVVRSERKTTALYVRDGKVEVRAPLKLPDSSIERFVRSKENWIRDKLAITNERAAQRDSFLLDYGSSIYYRGKPYPIAAKDGNRVGFDGERFYMPPDLTPEQIKEASIQIYRMLAKRDLTNRTFELMQKMPEGPSSEGPSSIKITGAKTRWASCSGKKSISFSWRIIMADDDVIDYIIVHELAHLSEMNHSAQFWNIVEGVLPDHSARRERLKELQHRLDSENWG